MASKKLSKSSQVTEYQPTELLPRYSNTVRIHSTEDNVYLDFGFVDPVQASSGAATVVGRIVMNRSTFKTFTQHVEQIAVPAASGQISAVIMSRCPVKEM
jgi:hypothetical protein